MTSLMNGTQATSTPCAEHLILSANSSNIFGQCLQLQVFLGNQNTSTIMSLTGYKEFDVALNNLKEKAICLLNAILEKSYKTKYASKLSSSSIYLLCSVFGPIAMTSLLTTCTVFYDKLEEIVDDDTLGNLLSGMLGLLSNMLEENTFYPLFSQNLQRIIVDIALVFLQTTKKEKEQIINDPQNFVNLALDTCDKQSSEICKTEAAKLLEAMCDHIDGSLSFVSRFCSEAIKYACKGCHPEMLANYPFLAQFPSSLFILKSSQEIIIETSFLVMADISYLTPKRKDVL